MLLCWGTPFVFSGFTGKSGNEREPTDFFFLVWHETHPYASENPTQEAQIEKRQSLQLRHSLDSMAHRLRLLAWASLVLWHGEVGATHSGHRAFGVEPPAAHGADPFSVATSALVARRLAAAARNREAMKKQPLLRDIDQAQRHATLMSQRLVDRAAAFGGLAMCVPRAVMPLLAVHDTQFQHLVSNVLSDKAMTGVSSIYAERGTGKSIAVTLAMLQWASQNPRSITVSIRGDMENLKDFFLVEQTHFISAVAEHVFRMLSKAGIRFQIILNIFIMEMGEHAGLLINLARAAHGYGQVIVVTQFREVAEEVAVSNGERTCLAPQQENIFEYRWNETQARELILYLNASARLGSGMPGKSHRATLWNKILCLLSRRGSNTESGILKALQAARAELTEDEQKRILSGARMPDIMGGWKPVSIIEFLHSGRSPLLSRS